MINSFATTRVHANNLGDLLNRVLELFIALAFLNSGLSVIFIFSLQEGIHEFESLPGFDFQNTTYFGIFLTFFDFARLMLEIHNKTRKNYRYKNEAGICAQ